jgi:4-carboxymuconolactone decarboxylase
MCRLSNRRMLLASSCLLVLFPVTALAQDRLPPIPAEKYTEAQKKAAAEFLAVRKVPVFGPFETLLRSPELMNAARAMGDYLRYKPAIGTTLSELVILITAREWTQDYEWYVHQPIALKAGLKPELLEAIRDGRRPVAMSADEEVVYDLCQELHRNKRVSDATYARALKRFGEQGVIDLVGISGYYTFLAMTMNTARSAVPAGGQRLPRLPE